MDMIENLSCFSSSENAHSSHGRKVSFSPWLFSPPLLSDCIYLGLFYRVTHYLYCYEKWCNKNDYFLLCKHGLFLRHFPWWLLTCLVPALEFFLNIALKLLDSPGLESMHQLTLKGSLCKSVCTHCHGVHEFPSSGELHSMGIQVLPESVAARSFSLFPSGHRTCSPCGQINNRLLALETLNQVTYCWFCGWFLIRL